MCVYNVSVVTVLFIDVAKSWLSATLPFHWLKKSLAPARKTKTWSNYKGTVELKSWLD